MRKVIIRIPTPLRAFTEGAGEISVEAGTVGGALAVLGRTHDGILERVLDARGRVRRVVEIYVDDEKLLSPERLYSPLDGDSVITIVPAGGEGTCSNAA